MRVLIRVLLPLLMLNWLEAHVHAENTDRAATIHLHLPAKLRSSTGPAEVLGMSPQLIRIAYGFDRIKNTGDGQTLAIVEAYDDPAIEGDLGVFSKQFGLPPCTTENGCFEKIYLGGKTVSDTGWAMETALDVEWAHAIAPGARILLVEAASETLTDLFQAVDRAVQSGAAVVSMSWGAGEFRGDSRYDAHFNVRNVVFIASSGDGGHGVEYPAVSAFVVGVGGTTLSMNTSGMYTMESAWSGSGGGVSSFTSEPPFQLGFQNTSWRGVPDVAYNANPETGYAVYTSAVEHPGWIQMGGTSAGAPQWAALFSIANSLRAAGGKQPLSTVDIDLYGMGVEAMVSGFNPVASGSDGNCGALCTAAPEYNFVTGLGTPRANKLIPALEALP